MALFLINTKTSVKLLVAIFQGFIGMLQVDEEQCFSDHTVLRVDQKQSFGSRSGKNCGKQLFYGSNPSARMDGE